MRRQRGRTSLRHWDLNHLLRDLDICLHRYRRSRSCYRLHDFDFRVELQLSLAHRDLAQGSRLLGNRSSILLRKWTRPIDLCFPKVWVWLFCPSSFFGSSSWELQLYLNMHLVLLQVGRQRTSHFDVELDVDHDAGAGNGTGKQGSSH